MKKIFLLIVFLCAGVTLCNAQGVDSKKFSVGVETSLLRGTSDIELDGYSPVSFYGGYNINSHLFVGAGFGFTKYYGSLLLPLNLKVQWSPFDWALAPYLGCDVGYNLLGGRTVYELAQGGEPIYDPMVSYGFFVRPELGVNLRISPSSSIYLSAGIYSQDGEFERHYIKGGDAITEVIDCISVVSLKFGYKFSF